ncbi:MAG: nucleotide exchange factor GrpE [Candidatus Magasanikbacteria bacterium CG11_big_fil_rev_8_21_14_0_20_39_34]|uniref:Protein GrpE n=1 Tax=Candidatus Magasanikbacteria bacterium CG11_big_fil_rev_8_21_14_0_20_39_34 TaxID=1974653 RepID=A0A2H0N4P9_9BACT|nr:MAG: nucleotide exchange factor GrpE [Candidatus Magasanikbacteria bacterium CG11_big_fil_rev_8_21_14_0_20_39_34]
MSKKEKQIENEIQEDQETLVTETSQENGECENCAQYKLGWLRAQADYQNLQKEVSTQRSAWAKMSEVQILEEFIPIYENFKKAFAFSVQGLDSADSSQASWENWKKGIEYIMKQFWTVLSAHGIEEIKTVGEPFDPAMHEAVKEEDNDECEDGIVLQELSGGYKTSNGVIQAARVVVCRRENK